MIVSGITDVCPAPERVLASWLCLHCQADGPAQREWARLALVAHGLLHVALALSADGAPQDPEILSDVACDWALDGLPCLPEGPDPWEDA